MADSKTPAVSAAAKTKPHEFDELKGAAEEAAKLESMLSLFSPVKGLGAVSGIAEMSEIQLRHAVIPKADVVAGEGKDFQKAFDHAYRFDRLPEVKTPTRTGVFIIEDTPKMVDEKNPFVHGHGVAAYGMAASKAVTGKEFPVQLINRLPMEKELGLTLVGLSKTPSGGVERKLGTDLVQGILKKDIYDKNSVNVFSASFTVMNFELESKADRLKAAQKLEKYLPKNTVLVVASGNDETQLNPGMKHNAMRHLPNTLVVGAAHLQPVMGPGGEFNAYSLTHYSAQGADIVMVATPPGARFSSTTEEGVRHLPQRGTSTAAPQAAAVVGHLLRRFAVSKENPDAVLSEQDVVLALKNTAQPLHLAVLDKVAYDIKVEPPTEKRFGRQGFAIQNYRIGEHFASMEAGNGIADPKAAWALLEKQEKAVREGKAKVLPRKDVAVALKPKAHDTVKKEKYAMLPEGGPGKYFSYEIEVKDKLVADQIVLDLKAGDMSRSMLTMPHSERPHMFLVNPAGDLIEVNPSTGCRMIQLDKKGLMMEMKNDYLIARVAGMQGSAMKGTWKVLCSEKLEQIEMNFDRAMQPGHVGVTVKPDGKVVEDNLYRYADFTTYKRDVLDDMVQKDSSMLDFNLTKTGFPAHYTDIKLAQFTETDKKTAEQLVEARYRELKNRPALDKAVASGKPVKVLELLIPEEKKFEAFKAMLATEPKENILFLIKNGFAKVKETVPKGTNPSTALMEMVKARGRTMEPELVQAFIDAGADLHAQDEKGRTVLHYARNAEVQKILMEPDLNGKPGTRLFEVKDKEGKTYLEIPWESSMALPKERFMVEPVMLADVRPSIPKGVVGNKLLAV